MSIYEQWYKLEHKAPQYIDEAVYGLCEINRNQITEKTRIVANPGCYTTTSILTLYPMVKEGLIDPDTIILMQRAVLQAQDAAQRLPIFSAKSMKA